MNSQSVSVDHLEKLAKLKVAPEEKKKINSQLEETIDYFAILDQVSGLDQEQATFQVTNNTNIVAEDKTEKCLPREKILAKDRKYFTTKK